VLLTGSECKGKAYKYTEDAAPNHLEPLYVYRRDREVRKRWFDVTDHATIIDMGAEYGHWTLCAAAQGARMVYAIEPDKDYQLVLKINVHNNMALNEHCAIVKREIKLDQFIDHLSCPPPTIQYIRLAERYTNEEGFLNFMKNATKTIKTYKPKLIACFERNTGYLLFINAMMGLGIAFTNSHFASDNNEYCLVNFT
jgi:tRNA G37 N-methylase Trm5